MHRDVKPANLLLDKSGRVHVADFGIASATGLGSLTQTGTVLGTASYLSPEQAMGERATPASDLYSLAVVAFELLAGRRPYEGDSLAAEAAAHVTGELPSVCDVKPDLPRELDPVFAKALAKHPSERYGSCAEFVAALRGALDAAAGPTRAIGAVAARSPRRPRPAWLVPVLVALLLAGIAAGAAVALSGGDSPKGALAAAEGERLREDGDAARHDRRHHCARGSDDDGRHRCGRRSVRAEQPGVGAHAARRHPLDCCSSRAR